MLIVLEVTPICEMGEVIQREVIQIRPIINRHCSCSSGRVVTIMVAAAAMASGVFVPGPLRLTSRRHHLLGSSLPREDSVRLRFEPHCNIFDDLDKKRIDEAIHILAAWRGAPIFSRVVCSAEE